MRVSQVRAGDVLLFRKPHYEYSWGFINATPALQRQFPEIRARTGAAVNNTISALDDCPYTHAAIVLRGGTNNPWLAHADHEGLLQSDLESIRYEYGHADFALRRLKPEHAAKRRAIKARADALSHGTGRPYPYLEMFAAFCLLASRNRPVHLPMATAEQDRVLNVAIRQAVDAFAADALGHRLVRSTNAPGAASSGPVSGGGIYSPMCSSFVARVLQDVGLPIEPRVRPVAPEARPEVAAGSALDPRALDPDDLALIVGWLGTAFKTMHHPPSYWEEGITAAVTRDPHFIPKLADLADPTRRPPTRAGWIEYLNLAPPAPGTSVTIQVLLAMCAAAAKRPVVHVLASPWDLEHCELFTDVVPVAWPPAATK